MAPIPSAAISPLRRDNNIMHLVRAHLLHRSVEEADTTAIVPTAYNRLNDGPLPLAVVGIVLGSVGGFLMLLWLLYTCMRFGARSPPSAYTDSVMVTASPPSSSRKHRRKSRSTSRRETVEIRRQRTNSMGPPVLTVRETDVEIVMPEPQPPPPVAPMPMPREPERVERLERIVVEEHRETRRERNMSGGSDEVVVIEEHSPPRKMKSDRDRDSRRRSRSHSERRESGYRAVDPLTHGGVVGGSRRSTSSRRG